METQIDLDLTDPAAFVTNDPHDFFQDVRRSRPVYWHDGTPGFWVVARHEDVLAGYADARRLSSARGTILETLLRGGDPAGGRMLAVMDRPRHRDLRTLMQAAFSPRVLGAVETSVRRRASALVQEVLGRGEFDFASEVAEQIPMHTICDLLSIPDEDRSALLRWNKQAVSAETADVDELDSLEARSEIVSYFMDLAQERQRSPRDDVISVMTDARVGDSTLTLEEIALNCYSLILGGDESSRVTAICAVKALGEHGDQWDALRSGKADLGPAVEELLRWATPSMHFARTALEDLSMGGHRIRAGDLVTLWNISANDDERVFDKPRQLDLARSPNRHVSFGRGPHFCLGAFLGRAELRSLLQALRSSVREIHLTGTPAPIYSTFLQGFSTLPVAFS